MKLNDYTKNVIRRRTPNPNPKPKTEHQYPLESVEQITVISWSRWNISRYPDLARLIHIPLGEYRAKSTGNLIKKLGGQRGFPDLLLPTPRRGYHSLAIELKRQKGAKSAVSAEQIGWIDYLNSQGWLAKICYGADDCISLLKWYLS